MAVKKGTPAYERMLQRRKDTYWADVEESRRKQRAYKLALYHSRHPDAEYRPRSGRSAGDTRALRLQMLTDIKKRSGCVDCGYNENVRALEFDHVRGEKLGNPTGMVACNIDLLTAEVLKCDVRCANCHRIRTYAHLEEAS